MSDLSKTTKRIAPSGVAIDVAGANTLMCRTLAVFNESAAARLDDIHTKLAALDCADLWAAEATRLEVANGKA
jgi:hypothetical protein